MFAASSLPLHTTLWLFPPSSAHGTAWFSKRSSSPMHLLFASSWRVEATGLLFHGCHLCNRPARMRIENQWCAWGQGCRKCCFSSELGVALPIFPPFERHARHTYSRYLSDGMCGSSRPLYSNCLGSRWPSALSFSYMCHEAPFDGKDLNWIWKDSGGLLDGSVQPFCRGPSYRLTM